MNEIIERTRKILITIHRLDFAYQSVPFLGVIVFPLHCLSQSQISHSQSGGGGAENAPSNPNNRREGIKDWSTPPTHAIARNNSVVLLSRRSYNSPRTLLLLLRSEFSRPCTISLVYLRVSGGVCSCQTHNCQNSPHKSLPVSFSFSSFCCESRENRVIEVSIPKQII